MSNPRPLSFLAPLQGIGGETTLALCRQGCNIRALSRSAKPFADSKRQFARLLMVQVQQLEALFLIQHCEAVGGGW